MALSATALALALAFVASRRANHTRDAGAAPAAHDAPGPIDAPTPIAGIEAPPAARIDQPDDITRLRARDLAVPVAGVDVADLRDTFAEARGTGRHEAIDILAARGTPVLAVDRGRIAKLFTSKPGGLTIYQFDRDERYAYYYAHLDSYAPGLAEGQHVDRGQRLGSVGSTGNAPPDAPHLHFAIFRLGPEKRWWKGEPIDPFRVWR